MDISDRQLAMEELLDLLDEMGAGELGQLLRMENGELKTLREQSRAHEQALRELKQHLHKRHVGAGGGSLATLALSTETKNVLGLYGSQTEYSGMPAASAAPGDDVPSHEALVQTVDQLRHKVAEQRADMDDMETALRESRAAARDLRSRLRMHELRQFAVASHSVGVGRPGSEAWSVKASGSDSGADISLLAENPNQEQAPVDESSAGDDESSEAAAATVSTRSTRVDAQGVYLHGKQHQAVSGVFGSSASGFSSAARLRSLVTRGPRRLCSSLAARFRRTERINPSASLFNL
ncbi:hypothetical protein EV175_003545 [Coemansia sp. RSA 1933]|nr:hypothetical protein EV175_003545 [Coemansia sp. RSA 1933]